MVFRRLALSCLIPLLSLGGCEAESGAAPTPLVSSKGSTRIASYNIEWLGEGLSSERMTRLKEVISTIQPNILAMQEIESSAALSQIFDRSWSFAMLDSRGEDQEVVLAVREPYKLVTWKMIYSERKYENAFPNDRDLLRAEVKTPGGETIVCFVVHLKSRGGGRTETDLRRLTAAQLIAKQIQAEKSPYIFVAGDFNDSPNDTSLNTLEREGRLVNLMDDLYKQDYVSLDIERYSGHADLAEPRIAGAARENEKFRGRTYDYYSDVKIKSALFDQIVVSQDLNNRLSGGAKIFWKKGLSEGLGPKTQDGRVTDQGTRPSDHLPVYADFKLP